MFNNIKEIIKYRTLISALVGRHLRSRYRGSVLGFLWSLINPLCLMGVYSLVFSYYIRFQEVHNYSLFLLCGLLPWIWITSALSEGTSSIVSSGHLITKSIFPAHILPLVSTLTTLIHFLLSLPILVIFMLAYGVHLPATLLFLPVIILIQIIFLYGLSLFFGSMNVLYRDVQHIVANLLSLLFFLCPVVYSFDSIPERFKFTVKYNPFALFIKSYHDLIMDSFMPSLETILLLILWSVISVFFGSVIYSHYKEDFAELF